MNKYPLVSVLITVYNREKYISAAIESVLNSTLIDFELIVVDDCSKDNSYLIAKEYGSIDSRVTVYQNEVNLGDYNNRNKAAGYAVGKYLKYVDADDLIYPHGLDVMVSAMESFPDSVLGTQSNLRQDDLPYPFSINPQESFLSHFLYGGTFLSGPTGVIIRMNRRFIVNSMRQLVFKNEKKMTILLFKRARVSVFDFLQAIFH